MKNFKLFMMIILILSVLTASGCKGKDSPSPTKKPSDEQEESFNYSEPIDDNGYWKNIKALDYVELCDYKNISVSKDIHEISEDKINDEIEDILAGFATEKEVKDRAVKDRDTVNIDYVGKVDGKEFEGGSTNGEGTEVTIGETQYIDDFLEQLIGHKPGETFDIEVTFPKDYGVDELNGKDAVFTVTINYIVETVMPELTDAFVKEKLSGSYGWNTVAEMKEQIRSDLQKAAISDYVNNYILENTKVKSIPESMIKFQENMMLYYVKSESKNYGMELNQYLSLLFGVSDEKELLKKYSEQNENSAKMNLIVQAISEDIKLTISDDDLSSFFKDELDTEDYSDYEKEYGKPYLKFIVLSQRVNDYLVNNVKKL